MSTEVFSAVGERLDLEVRRGMTLGPIPHSIVLDDGNDTPFDLTGYAFQSFIRPYQGTDDGVVMSFDTSRLVDGIYTFGLSDETTLLLRAGKSLFSPTSRYFWQTSMTDPDGRVIPLYYGELRVAPDAAPV